MVNCLELLHRCNIVHGDVKAENFAISATNCRKIVIFDFGLSHQKLFVTPGFSGTMLYASIAAHENRPMQPKDDIESLAYTLADFHQALPWKHTTWPKELDKQNKYGLKAKRNKNIFAMTPSFFELTLFLMHVASQNNPSHTYLKEIFRYNII